jgi:hypothetical protein
VTDLGIRENLGQELLKAWALCVQGDFASEALGNIVLTPIPPDLAGAEINNRILGSHNPRIGVQIFRRK